MEGVPYDVAWVREFGAVPHAETWHDSERPDRAEVRNQRHESALARVAADGPHNFASAVLRVDQYHCLGRQSLRRLSSPGREVAPNGICRIGAGCGRKRAPEKIDAPARVARRITRVSAELRGAEVPRSAPPSRERPVVIVGIEGPDVEVLDAVLLVHVVQGSTLAQGPAQETTGISAGAVRIPPEELGLGVGGQRGESKQVSYFDPRQRAIRIRRHAAILSAAGSIRCRHERSAAEECAQLHRPLSVRMVRLCH